MAREVEKRTFKYKKRTKEDLKERANMRGGNFDSIVLPKFKMFKIHDGKNLIRVLPPTWKDASHYGYDLWVNYGIGVDNQSYLSLSRMKNEKDPLAEARREAERAGDKDLAKALQPRQRIGMWVIDRMAEDEGPQFWACPFSFDKDLASISMDEDTKEVTFIDDPENGCDVRFYKEGTGLGTKYPAAKMKLLKPSPIHEDEAVQQEWLEYIADNPIPDCLQFYDYEHISTAFDGQARVERDEDEDEKPSRKRQPKEEEADEEDDAPPLKTRRRGADEDDDEKPSRSRARVSRDEDEDEDDETDKKPSRRRVKADDEEEDEKPEKPSLRDRLRQRRRETPDEED